MAAVIQGISEHVMYLYIIVCIILCKCIMYMGCMSKYYITQLPLFCLVNDGALFEFKWIVFEESRVELRVRQILFRYKIPMLKQYQLYYPRVIRIYPTNLMKRILMRIIFLSSRPIKTMRIG